MHQQKIRTANSAYRCLQPFEPTVVLGRPLAGLADQLAERPLEARVVKACGGLTLRSFGLRVSVSFDRNSSCGPNTGI